ncbi:MAG: hypothetical protein ACLFTK_14690 [Anaerolineales bacterium]
MLNIFEIFDFVGDVTGCLFGCLFFSILAGIILCMVAIFLIFGSTEAETETTLEMLRIVNLLAAR